MIWLCAGVQEIRATLRLMIYFLYQEARVIFQGKVDARGIEDLRQGEDVSYLVIIWYLLYQQ
jgi:hypothetical protein